MPKQRPFPDTQQDRELVAAIKSALIKNGLTENDIATSLHISRNTFNSRMKSPEKFTLKELRVLKRRLKMDVII